MAEVLSLLQLQPGDFEDKVLAGEGSIMVLFDDGSDVAATLTTVLEEAVTRHADRLRGFRADGEAFADLRRQYEEARTIVDSFHLNDLPVIALFRKGKLITTFEPWMHYAGKRLWKQDLTGQFETFLEKMVYYDPEKVRVQTNLKLNIP